MEKSQERELILKALTDPGFRRSLETDPRMDERTRNIILGTISGINAQVAAAGDQILCAPGPGPCGIC